MLWLHVDSTDGAMAMFGYPVKLSTPVFAYGMLNSKMESMQKSVKDQKVSYAVALPLKTKKINMKI